jgi:hypothetical protein
VLCVPFLAAVLVTSCGPSGIGGDRLTAFLPEVGFENPIEVEAALVSMGRPSPGDRVALLAQVGAVSILPWPESEPYWRAGTDLPVDGATVKVPFARRRITGRQEARSWKEGGSEYFSETLSYVLDIDPLFAELGGKQLGPYQVRMTIANNPRVGHWTLQSADFSSGDLMQNADRKDAGQLISTLGQAALPAMRSEIERARIEAYGLIERQLADDGLIERISASPYMFLRKRDQLAYYIFPERLGAASIDEVVAKCDGLNLDGYGKWRVATGRQLQLLKADRGGMIDTPDGRLWNGLDGTAVTPSYHGHGRSDRFSFYAAPPGKIYGPYIDGFSLKGGVGTSASFKPSYQTWYGDQITQTAINFGEIMLICTATIGGDPAGAAADASVPDTSVVRQGLDNPISGGSRLYQFDGEPPKLIARSSGGEMIASILAEDAATLTVRIAVEDPWIVSIGADINQNGVIDANSEGNYSSSGSILTKACNFYKLSENSTTPCGGFSSRATFSETRDGRVSQIVRRIPKNELSRNGASAMLRFTVRHSKTGEVVTEAAATHEFRIR